jgi:RNA ligase
MKIDFDAINREIDQGYINAQWHPSGELLILNYSQRAQYDWRWNAETMQCRGLIVDEDNRIVARPFPKFFSYEQLNGVVPNEPFEAYEKLDGSLGVLYFHQDSPAIATRGSFTSPQAVRATEILRQKYSGVSLDSRLTYLFEIIVPENRIVVDYGDTEDIVLLATIETATGCEVPTPEIGFPVVKRYDGINDFAELLSQQDGSREGFVVRFQSGQRVKIKFDEYKRLHKLLTGVNPKHIWQALMAGDDLNKLIERVPDEYFQWVKATEAELRARFDEVESATEAIFASRPLSASRKDAASYFRQFDNQDVLFLMLDGKPYADKIWKKLRPEAAAAFRCDGDA